MFLTREKNVMSNQNRERCLFTCEKNDTYVQSKATEVCELRAKIPPCSLQRPRFLVRFLIGQQLVRKYRM